MVVTLFLVIIAILLLAMWWELHRLVSFFTPQRRPTHNVLDEPDSDLIDGSMYQQAVEEVREADMVSTALLQRKLQIGYKRASRLIEMMVEKGVVSQSTQSEYSKVIK